jgi:flagellar assembly protein FliH
MSSTVIPKEQLSAYQRWEMASFGDERPSTLQQNAVNAASARQSAEQIAQLQEEARKQGYAAGLEQGRAAGLEAGRKDAAREVQQLRQVAASFGSEVARASETVSDDLLNLALDLSKAMLKTALNIRPELMLPVVAEAIRYLPSLQHPALLVLNPADATLVKQHMSDELEKAGWRVAEDVQMARGGCRVETASNQIDASPSVRWQRIAEALGKQSDWLE